MERPRGLTQPGRIIEVAFSDDIDPSAAGSPAPGAAGNTYRRRVIASPTSDGCDRCVDRGRSSLDAAAVEVVAEQLSLPESYGTPRRVLTWQEVEQKLVASKTYWLATVRLDGRPHTVPVDGIWWEGALFFGGDPVTVHIRNLRDNPRAVIHTESGESPVIAEGIAEWHQPSEDEISGLVTVTQAKYGYPASPDSYRAGTWRLTPGLVLAWNVLYQDATRFTFG